MQKAKCNHCRSQASVETGGLTYCASCWIKYLGPREDTYSLNSATLSEAARKVRAKI
jgi:uncharacterized Zn ribbon protein